MNLERIAEIEAAAEVTLAALGDHSKTSLNAAVALELCRLARLGLRVEGAPTAEVIGGKFKGNSRVTVSVPDDFIGKRVALVMVEESK